MAELTDRILAAANSLDQEHQREWRHWEEVAQSQETWDKAIAMVLAEVEAQASIDTHEQRHAEKEMAPVGPAPGIILPRKIWKAPELAASSEKCSYCGLWLRRDSVHRRLASFCPARILSGAPLPEPGGRKRNELWQPCVCGAPRRRHIRRSPMLEMKIVLWWEASQTLV